MRKKCYFSCGIYKSRLFQNKKLQVQMEKPEKADFNETFIN